MSQAEKNSLTSKASSINRALDQIGDKWCLLILQEVFWGINTFNQMHQATGASRGVLTDRLDWLQSIDCLQKHHGDNGRPIYHLTRKSMELYQTALMAISWERKYFTNPNLDSVESWCTASVVKRFLRKCSAAAVTRQLRLMMCNSGQVRALVRTNGRLKPDVVRQPPAARVRVLKTSISIWLICSVTAGQPILLRWPFTA